MQGKALIPGVQHQLSGDFAAEPARVAAELEQRRRGREQPRIERARMGEGEAVEHMREREHDVEVAHRQEFGAARGEPAPLAERLALGAMTVAARAVAMRQRSAVLAAIARATERRGPTGRDRTQRPVLLGAQAVRGAIRLALRVHDIGQFER